MDESKYDNNQMMENSMKDEGKMGDTTDQGKGPAAALELEHAIGYSGMVYDSLVYHPNGQDFVYDGPVLPSSGQRRLWQQFLGFCSNIV